MRQQEQQEMSQSSATPISRLSAINQRRGEMMQSISFTLQSERVIERRDQMRQGLQNVGSKLQQLNLGKLINQMEQDQGLADQLESLNEHILEEKKFRDIRREAEEACLKNIQEHLEGFLLNLPDATFEQWIEDVHPENAHDGQLLEGMGKEIDMRLYVEESDHRKLWNQYVTDPLRQISPRTRMLSDNAKAQQVVDLLSENLEHPQDTASNTSVTDNQNGDLIQF